MEKLVLMREYLIKISFNQWVVNNFISLMKHLMNKGMYCTHLPQHYRLAAGIKAIPYT